MIRNDKSRKLRDFSEYVADLQEALPLAKRFASSVACDAVEVMDEPFRQPGDCCTDTGMADHLRMMREWHEATWQQEDSQEFSWLLA